MRHLIIFYFLSLSLIVHSQDNFIGKYSGCVIKGTLECDYFLKLELKSNNKYLAIMDKYGSIDSVYGHWHLSDSTIYLEETPKPERYSILMRYQDTLAKRIQFWKDSNYKKHKNLLNIANKDNNIELNLLEVNMNHLEVYIYCNSNVLIDTLGSYGELFYENNADSIFLNLKGKMLKYIPEKYSVPTYIYLSVTYSPLYVPKRFRINKNGKLEYYCIIGHPLATNNKKKKKTLKKIE
jgi:hypothetical protein